MLWDDDDDDDDAGDDDDIPKVSLFIPASLFFFSVSCHAMSCHVGYADICVCVVL